jgi:hypothetical protein
MPALLKKQIHKILPSKGSKPPMIFKNVVLPEPFFPLTKKYRCQVVSEESEILILNCNASLHSSIQA